MTLFQRAGGYRYSLRPKDCRVVNRMKRRDLKRALEKMSCVLNSENLIPGSDDLVA